MVILNAQCLVYKTPKREGAYLYLKSSVPLEQLPESLQQLFADRVEVLELTLTPTTKLATEDSLEVLANLHREGFHLQLKPDQVTQFFDL